MADAGALRRAAVAGHARAVVKHVGHVQLHVYVDRRAELGSSGFRSIDLSLSCAKGKADRASLFPVRAVFITSITRVHPGSVPETRGDPLSPVNTKSAHTYRRFFCPKLCETVPDDSYLWGNTSRFAHVRSSAQRSAPTHSLSTRRDPRTRMTSLAIPSRPIAARVTDGWHRADDIAISTGANLWALSSRYFQDQIANVSTIGAITCARLRGI